MFELKWHVSGSLLAISIASHVIIVLALRDFKSLRLYQRSDFAHRRFLFFFWLMLDLAWVS